MPWLKSSSSSAHKFPGFHCSPSRDVSTLEKCLERKSKKKIFECMTWEKYIFNSISPLSAVNFLPESVSTNSISEEMTPFKLLFTASTPFPVISLLDKVVTSDNISFHEIRSERALGRCWKISLVSSLRNFLENKKVSKILIAGASGFVGKALIKSLEADASLSIVALSRQKHNVVHSRLEWRQADLFSLKDIAESMEGCDQAVYLVHSMLPSASLVQGTFYDLDLILADNFARAAKINKISHIIYLGGLLPRDQSHLSWHLKSRLEVEDCLRNAAPKLTVLRAGMVLGEGGSSFVIMRRLVERLPVMLCPSWTNTLAQTIDLNDLILVFKKCFSDPTVQGKTWDIGGNKILSYQQMMKLTADILNKKIPFFSINVFYPTLSWLWVTLITGAPKALVYPLVQSLKHSMLVREEARFPYLELTSTPIEESIKRLVSKKEEEVHAFQTPIVLKAPKHVRSVQRLPLPSGKDAAWVADEYFKWLPVFLSFIIKTKVRNRLCIFYFLHPKITLLLLEKSIDRSTNDRQLLYIKGGLLAAKQTRARLEFREVLDKKYIIAGIHDFRPALPWIAYKYTQAVAHLIVMKSFGRHLKKLK